MEFKECGDHSAELESLVGARGVGVFVCVREVLELEVDHAEGTSDHLSGSFDRDHMSQRVEQLVHCAVSVDARRESDHVLERNDEVSPVPWLINSGGNSSECVEIDQGSLEGGNTDVHTAWMVHQPVHHSQGVSNVTLELGKLL